ncbi:MDH2 (YOL126C) [Zygosaccharomyces parabailii]|nr:MDH2 (YOL126C) [Zygosaccharomyces parabailii]CDH12966.1 related to MDH2-Malate dehydrogenase,cytoplasmic [Zygosaccharomyces bailii ISA1307]
MPHSVNEDIKITVVGAAGGIGQSLSLLLKTQLASLLPSHRHAHLALYDVNADAVRGVTADLSHIDTGVSVSGYEGDGIGGALEHADVVLIPAGVPRKPGMTREDLLAINAKIIKSLGASIAKYCDLSKVFVLLISNPINSLVPVLVKELEAHAPGLPVERRVFGITRLDAVRASTFLHEATVRAGSTPKSNTLPYVPVIGGHSGETIVPLFSLVPGASDLSKDTLKELVHRVQYGGDEVVKAKNGAGSATLSMAHAAYKVVESFIPLLTGSVPSIEGTFYVALQDSKGQPINASAQKLLSHINGLPYFAAPLRVTSAGVDEVDAGIIERMSVFERERLLAPCLGKLQGNISTGLSL